MSILCSTGIQPQGVHLSILCDPIGLPGLVSRDGELTTDTNKVPFNPIRLVRIGGQD